MLVRSAPTTFHTLRVDDLTEYIGVDRGDRFDQDQLTMSH
jgi:hypothetical protein